jgi:hypothetical protein
MRYAIILAGLCLFASVASAAVWMFPNGSTSVSICVDVYDPNGDPNGTINVADYDLYYLEQGSAWAAKIDVTALAAADSAYSSGKAFDCGHGTVRLDIPDASLDGGIGHWAEIRLYDQTGATDDGAKDKIEPVKVLLGGAVDLRYVAGASAGATNLNTIFNTDYSDTYNATDKRLRADLDYFKGDACPDSNSTGRLPVVVRKLDDGTDVGDPRLLDYAIDVQADGSVVTGDLTAAGAAAVAAAVGALAGSSSLLLDAPTTVATAIDANSFMLDDGSAADGYYANTSIVIVLDASDSDRGGAGYVRSYVGASKTVTLDRNLPFIPDTGDTVYLIGLPPLGRGRVSP